MRAKPETLYLDGQIWNIDYLMDGLETISPWVHYPGGNLSPFEAEELKNWLTSFIEWNYDKKEESNA